MLAKYFNLLALGGGGGSKKVSTLDKYQERHVYGTTLGGTPKTES